MMFALIFVVFHIFIFGIIEAGLVQQEKYFINKQIYLETKKRDEMRKNAEGTLIC